MVNERIRYEPVAEIGAGGFGVVTKCHDLLTGHIVAVKKIKIYRKEGVPSYVIREVSLLKELQHKNIIRLLDVLSIDDSIALVFELLDCNLKNFMNSQKRVASKAHQIKKYLYQILHGLAHCHAHKVVHRDLKPANLLIDRDNDIVKLADFGLARAVGVYQKQYTEGVGSNFYTAPEIMLGGREYYTSVDIWSVGCIFAEMVTNQHLFPGRDADSQLIAIFRVLGTPDPETKLDGYDTFSKRFAAFGDAFLRKTEDLAELVPGLEPAGMDLLNKMLSLDPNKRITAHEALEHEYFKDVQKKTCFLQLFHGILVGISNLKDSICGRS